MHLLVHYRHPKLTNKFFLFIFPVFFMILADMTMSFVFPIIVERHLQSSIMLGIVMSLSSVAGLSLDVLLPRFVTRGHWYTLLVIGITLSLVFPLAAVFSDLFFPFFFLVFASVVWGLYFELFQFAQQDFIATQEKNNRITKDWGILVFLLESCAIIGPIIGASIIDNSIVTLVTVWFFEFIALALLLVLFKRVSFEQEVIPRIHITLKFAIIRDIRALEILGERIFPLIVLTFSLFSLNATFWTIGGLYGEELSNGLLPSWSFLATNSVTLLVGTSFISLYKVRGNLRRLSQIALLVSGLALTGIVITDDPIAILGIALVASLAMAIVNPLNESVFSELCQRAQFAEVYILTLNRTTISVSYIITPLVAGYLSDAFGYKATFIIMGGITAITGVLLLSLHSRRISLEGKDLSTLLHSYYRHTTHQSTE